MSLVRERLLARLVEAHAISPELVRKLLAWKHPGFSAHVGEPISPEEKLRLCDTAAYLERQRIKPRTQLPYWTALFHTGPQWTRVRCAHNSTGAAWMVRRV